MQKALGKLTLPDQFHLTLAEQGFEELPVRIHHAHAISQLPPIHKDPFDRLLIAQATTDGLTLISRGDVISRYGLETLLA